jgi:GntR family transcriptional regulator
MKMLIHRDHPKPLHSQLTEIIRERIQQGIYPAKSRLPSEREICEEFGVSRTTVREMIRQLKKESLIIVQAGRGAFVRSPQRNISVHISLDGFSTDLARAGKTPSSKLLGLEVISQPDEYLSKVMKLATGDELVKVERLRLDNSIPLAIHTVWLNHRFCPQILTHNLAKNSLFSILRDVYKLKIQKASQNVFASLADSRERKLLSLPNPSSVLHAERTTYLDSGEIIEFSRATYCGDFYHLMIDLDASERTFSGDKDD